LNAEKLMGAEQTVPDLISIINRSLASKGAENVILQRLKTIRDVYSIAEKLGTIKDLNDSLPEKTREEMNKVYKLGVNLKGELGRVIDSINELTKTANARKEESEEEKTEQSQKIVTPESLEFRLRVETTIQSERIIQRIKDFVLIRAGGGYTEESVNKFIQEMNGYWLINNYHLKEGLGLGYEELFGYLEKISQTSDLVKEMSSVVRGGCRLLQKRSSML
jgi:hypothetical protein